MDADMYMYSPLSVCVSVTACPALPVPDDGGLSTNLALVYTVVTVSCNEGFIHLDGVTSKTLLCTEFSVWNDTYSNCTGTVRAFLKYRVIVHVQVL